MRPMRSTWPIGPLCFRDFHSAHDSHDGDEEKSEVNGAPPGWCFTATGAGAGLRYKEERGGHAMDHAQKAGSGTEGIGFDGKGGHGVDFGARN